MIRKDTASERAGWAAFALGRHQQSVLNSDIRVRKVLRTSVLCFVVPVPTFLVELKAKYRLYLRSK